MFYYYFIYFITLLLYFFNYYFIYFTTLLLLLLFYLFHYFVSLLFFIIILLLYYLISFIIILFISLLCYVTFFIIILFILLLCYLISFITTLFIPLLCYFIPFVTVSFSLKFYSHLILISANRYTRLRFDSCSSLFSPLELTSSFTDCVFSICLCILFSSFRFMFLYVPLCISRLGSVSSLTVSSPIASIQRTYVRAISGIENRELSP